MKKTGMLLVSLTLIVFLVSCGSQNEHLSKGKELIKSNKRRKEEKAVVAFKRAVAQEPDNAEAQYLLGYYNSDREIDVEIGDALGRMGIKLKDDGVVVTQVQPRSPADLAGIKVGDVIKMVNARDIKDETDYEDAINQTLAKNTTIKLNIEGRQVEVAEPMSPSKRRGGETEDGLGLVVKDNGVIVGEVQPQSPASLEYYIEAGDKVLTVDGKEILNVADYENAVKDAMGIRKTVKMRLKASAEMRGERMYLAYKNDKKKYLEILVYETLRDREQEIQESALTAIKRIYDKGKKDRAKLLKSLFDAIKSKDNRDRHDASLALAHLGNRNDGDPDTIIPKLIDLLDHKRMQTRLNTVLALGEIGDKRAIEPLVQRIASGSEEKEKKRENPEVRRLAVEALGKIGKTDDQNVRRLVVDNLIQLLENKGSSMRVDAIEALMEIGDESAVPSLLYVLEEKGSRKVEVNF